MFTPRSLVLGLLLIGACGERAKEPARTGTEQKSPGTPASIQDRPAGAPRSDSEPAQRTSGTTPGPSAGAANPPGGSPPDARDAMPGGSPGAATPPSTERGANDMGAGQKMPPATTPSKDTSMPRGGKTDAPVDGK